jgi:hypothetical protein
MPEVGKRTKRAVIKRIIKRRVQGLHGNMIENDASEENLNQNVTKSGRT